jgi:hypothetical protein
MTQSIDERWRNTFLQTVQRYENGLLLREASLQGKLGVWTIELTSVVAATCNALGWQVSAKGQKLELLPISGCEYLGIDVMAFDESKRRWRFPLAAIELENSKSDDRIAYSLWKVLSVRAELRIVFCYRRTADQSVHLIESLREQVIQAMDTAKLLKLEGQTLLVVGSRANADTFPYGFFKWWRMDNTSGTFQRF